MKAVFWVTGLFFVTTCSYVGWERQKDDAVHEKSKKFYGVPDFKRRASDADEQSHN